MSTQYPRYRILNHPGRSPPPSLHLSAQRAQGPNTSGSDPDLRERQYFLGAWKIQDSNHESHELHEWIISEENQKINN